MNPVEASKEVVIFVHGFNSSKGCWIHEGKSPSKWRFLKFWKLWDKQKDLIGDLALKDPDMGKQFTFDFYEYKTKIVSLKPGQEIPSLADIAEDFSDWLVKKNYDKRQISLVGHSQGGLVILRYLKFMVKTRQAPRLGNVKQAILVASPQKGSTLLYTTRKLAGLIFENPQNEKLHVLDEDIDNMLELVTQNIIKASEKTDTTWPVPICCFYGKDDDIVTKASARGELADRVCFPLEGNHFTVIQPRDFEDDRYKDIKRVLFNPVGHQRILLIENYETQITISPEDKREKIKFEQREEVVHVESIGQINRKVRLSKRNLSEDKLKIKYRTLKENGFLKYKIGGPPERHRTTASEQQHYDDFGRRIEFFMKPQPGRPDTCFLNLQISNGFNRGNTNAHFHISPADQPLRFIEHGTYCLNLSAYVDKGIVPIDPELYHHPQNPKKCNEVCGTKVKEHFRKPMIADPQNGIWEWKLQNIDGGVIDIIWDFRVS